MTITVCDDCNEQVDPYSIHYYIGPNGEDLCEKCHLARKRKEKGSTLVLD